MTGYDTAPASSIRAGRPMLSVVSPVYMGAASLSQLVERCKAASAAVTNDYELILVDDSSPDESWDMIVRECEADRRVKGVRLSRNFGQNHAITAGLRAARGEYVVVIDCDLQDDPSYIPMLIGRAREGFDIVFTRKHHRAHGRTRNLFGGLFHWLINALIAGPVYRTESGVGSYSLISRTVVDAFLSLNDSQRHYLSLLRWLGFDASYVEIEHHERPHGRSSYTYRKLVREAVVGITSQSDRPLYLSVTTGFVFVLCASVAAVVLVVLWFTNGFLAGWTSIVVLLLLCTGMTLMALGVAGIYIAKIFDQARARPLYVVRGTLNLDTPTLTVSSSAPALTIDCTGTRDMRHQATLLEPNGSAVTGPNWSAHGPLD